MGSIDPPLAFDAANRLTTSIQSPCVAITARVEAISLPVLLLAGVKNCLWCVAWTIYKVGEKAQAYTNPLLLI